MKMINKWICVFQCCQWWPPCHGRNQSKLLQNIMAWLEFNGGEMVAGMGAIQNGRWWVPLMPLNSQHPEGQFLKLELMGCHSQLKVNRYLNTLQPLKITIITKIKLNCLNPNTQQGLVSTSSNFVTSSLSPTLLLLLCFYPLFNGKHVILYSSLFICIFFSVFPLLLRASFLSNFRQCMFLKV